MKSDFFDKCLLLSINQLKKTKEYNQIPKDIHRGELSKIQLCELLAIINKSNQEGSVEEFFSILRVVKELRAPSKSLKSPKSQKSNKNKLPKKFIRVVKPSRRLYHGRNVARSGGVWESGKDLKRIMWWALEKVTPLVYASTSPQGRSLDKMHKWDVYEARVKKESSFLLITKQSIEYLLNISAILELKCEGKSVGGWLKKAFPVIRGKLKRRSYIDSDRKMAVCLCKHISCSGYIADEIPVVNGPGMLHKELLVCNPSFSLRLYKYTSFSTQKGQTSVERYLNEKTTKLLPDKIKMYKSK